MFPVRHAVSRKTTDLVFSQRGHDRDWFQLSAGGFGQGLGWVGYGVHFYSCFSDYSCGLKSSGGKSGEGS